jgi:hypothetical protein
MSGHEAKQPLAEWQADAARAVGDQLVREIVADNRHSPTQASSVIAPKAVSPQARGSGWADPVPLAPRPASESAIIDRLCEKYVGGPNKVW